MDPGFRQDRAERKSRSVLFILFPAFRIPRTSPARSTAFEIANHFAPNAYDIRFASSAGRMVASSAGVGAADANAQRHALRKLDTLMISGGGGTRAAAADSLLLSASRARA